MSASGRCSQLKLLILLIKKCLCRGVDCECLFNGCLQSEQHQDGARLRACRLLFSFFFLLPPLSSTQTSHSSTQARAKNKHYTPCAPNNDRKKNSLETETNRQEKEALRNISSCLPRSRFGFWLFCLFFPASSFVYFPFTTTKSLITSRSARSNAASYFSFQEKSIEWMRSTASKFTVQTISDSEDQRLCDGRGCDTLITSTCDVPSNWCLMCLRELSQPGNTPNIMNPACTSISGRRLGWIHNTCSDDVHRFRKKKKKKKMVCWWQVADLPERFSQSSVWSRQRGTPPCSSWQFHQTCRREEETNRRWDAKKKTGGQIVSKTKAKDTKYTDAQQVEFQSVVG